MCDLKKENVFTEMNIYIYIQMVLFKYEYWNKYIDEEK